jgi:tRNA(Ile)-lysidine synthase
MAKSATAEISLTPDRVLVDRFMRDLNPLVRPDGKIGIAVSGGPDSLALLLLAAAARPGLVEAATVDHALRPESRAEAELVAGICEKLGVPHSILTVEWKEKPETAIQERARNARYGLLGRWAQDKGLRALLTAHHADDQAETLVMRMLRGAGVKGLAGMRRLARLPGGRLAVLRPLLGWRHAELEQLCADVGLKPVDDPSNADEQFERVRIRQALEGADWFNSNAVALSAANLAQADAALQWATTQEWKRAVTNGGNQIVYRPTDAPREIRRRIARRAILGLATEGRGDLRGPALDKVLTAMAKGQRATLRGVLCIGGKEWRFAKAPPRRA